MGADFYDYGEDYGSTTPRATAASSGGTLPREWMNFTDGPQGPDGCSKSMKYPDEKPYRQSLEGEAPWWFAFGPNNLGDDVSGSLGDRGFVVRSYDAVLNGTRAPQPAFSVRCEMVELSVPYEHGNELLPGDFVEFQLEVLVPLHCTRYADDAARTQSR